MTAESVVGPEGGAPEGLAMTVESRDIWLTNRSVSGRTVGEIREEADPGQARGIYLGGSPAACRRYRRRTAGAVITGAAA
jgi:hypothetical protein